MADVTDWKKGDARSAKDWLGMAKRDAAERNSPAARKEVQKMQALADETEAAYKTQLARDARVGAGRGEVNPNAAGMKKGGSVGSASKRADGIAERGKTRGKMV